jgi:hypothetical protein
MNFKSYIYISLLTISCANPVSPTGGPKDVTPPIISNIVIDTLPTEKRVSLIFDEYIKATNAIYINPQTKKPYKPILNTKRNALEFNTPQYVTFINLQKSICDINEGNIGTYPSFYFSNDTLQQTIVPRLPKYFKSDKDLLTIEKKIDTFYYRSFRIKDTLYINGFTTDSLKATYYIDINKNNTYDSSEWYTRKNIDSTNAVLLFPPIKNKIEIDTNHQYNILVLPFNLIPRLETSSDLHIQRFNDTVIIDKTNTTSWIQKNPNILLNYKKYNLKKYFIQTKIITQGDTQSMINPSIMQRISPNANKVDTLSKNMKIGSVVFENTDSLDNLEIILLKDNTYYQNISLTLKTYSVNLEQGEYTFISYIDVNKDKQLNQSKPSDRVIQYFETFLVKPSIENVIKVGKHVRNSVNDGGKTDGLLPTSIKAKKGVNQPNLIRE